MTLLIISGYECNGFAGLLRDIDVANHCLQTPTAVITTLTAQTSTELLATVAVEPTFVFTQLTSLQAAPTVIKIGLLPNRAIAQQIAQWLTSLSAKPFIIFDPVMTSSSNQQTFIREPLINIVEPLLPWVDLLTPNANELKALVNDPFSKDSTHMLAKRLFSQQPLFSGGLLVKGGHLDSTVGIVTDSLFQHHEPDDLDVYQWQQAKLDVTVRGTGCFLSTAIACAKMEGFNSLDAITLVKAKLTACFQQQLLGHTHLTFDWPTKPDCYPQVQHNRMLSVIDRPFPRLTVRQGLYPIVDSSQLLSTLATTGIKTIQLRIKNQPDVDLKKEIKTAVRIANKHNLQLFINDYWELAIEYGAYGVHLGQEDLVNANLPAIHAAGLRLGISTHGDFELQLAAQLQPSYLAVGAIFPTQTKDMGSQIQGLKRLKRYCQLIRNIPIVAIGGLNNDNIENVLNCGADMVAVVSAITRANDPANACQHLLLKCRHSNGTFN